MEHGALLPLRFRPGISNAFNFGKRGVIVCLVEEATLDDEHANACSEKFACHRQAGGTSADDDEIGLEKRPRREFGEIFYVHRMKSVREGNLLTRALTDKAGAAFLCPRSCRNGSGLWAIGKFPPTGRLFLYGARLRCPNNENRSNGCRDEPFKVNPRDKYPSRHLLPYYLLDYFQFV